jgi:hypothetical protein
MVSGSAEAEILQFGNESDSDGSIIGLFLVGGRGRIIIIMVFLEDGVIIASISGVRIIDCYVDGT